MMFIKGVKGGRDRGNPIEMSPSEKVEPAVKLAAANHPVWKDYRVWLTDLKTTKMDFSPNGDLLKKKWSNNRYRAEGKAKFYFRHQATDRVGGPRELDWKIIFCDCLDDSGQPHCKIIEFSVPE